MTRKIFLAIISITLTAMLFSCASPKKVLLFQDIDSLEEYSISQQNNPTIREDDLLIITVSAPDMDAVRPYNLMIETRPSYSSSNVNIGTRSQQQTYLVDNEGNIEFPILGRLHVAGMSRSE